MAAACIHLDTVHHTEGREGVEGCPECLAAGDRWMHLRRCAQCGAVGCCDDSPSRHATRHHDATGHPIIRSLEPGEDWYWCYDDELAFRVRED